MQVIWFEGQRGRWDHGMLMDVFYKHLDIFDQYNEPRLPSWGVESAIIVVAGDHDKDVLNEFLSTLRSALVIYTSDEEARWEIVKMPHVEVWSQYWKAGMEVDYKMLMGYPSRLGEFKINSHLPKEYLWSYVGQVQNEFREECVKVLKTLDGGKLQTVEFFGGIGKGAIDYQEYLDIICKSKYVICPPGSFSVESFRLYEALECGSIPITQMRSPKHPKDFNWWKEVYPDHNLMLIEHWNDLGAAWFDDQYYKERLKYNDWWPVYKEKLEKKLISYALN